MARLTISFKDKSEEEILLYNEIQKRACGDTSAYVKRIFRELYKMEEYAYTYTIERTVKNDSNENKSDGSTPTSNKNDNIKESTTVGTTTSAVVSSPINNNKNEALSTYDEEDDDNLFSGVDLSRLTSSESKDNSKVEVTNTTISNGNTQDANIKKMNKSSYLK